MTDNTYGKNMTAGTVSGVGLASRVGRTAAVAVAGLALCGAFIGVSTIASPAALADDAAPAQVQTAEPAAAPEPEPAAAAQEPEPAAAPEPEPAAAAQEAEPAAAPEPEPAAAAQEAGRGYQKDEVVYVKLDESGAQTGVYVVNTFYGASGEIEVVDPGTYTRYTSLVESSWLRHSNGNVRFTLLEGQTYRYQGDLSAQTSTPWTIAISCKLDGQEVAPRDIAGCSGRLEMTVEVAPNAACQPAFAQDFLLQVNGLFVQEVATDVVASGATLAKSGADTQVTYLVFPDASSSFTVSATVKDFRFDGWTIVGVPFTMSVGDIIGSVLGTGSQDDDPSDEGASSGLADLVAGVDEISEGAVDLAAGLRTLSTSAGVMRTTVSLVVAPAAESLAASSATYASSVEGDAQAARDSAAATAVTIEAAQAAYQNALAWYLQSYGWCISSGIDPNTDTQTVEAAQGLVVALEAFINARARAASYTAVADALDGAAAGYADIDATLQGLVDDEGAMGIHTLTDAISSLVNGTVSAAASASDLSAGISSLAGSVQTLTAGLVGQADESAAVAPEGSDAASAPDAAGSASPDAAASQDEGYLDFAAGGQSRVGSLQFVYMTPRIAPQEAEADEPQTESEQENPFSIDTFLNKFLGLFGQTWK